MPQDFEIAIAPLKIEVPAEESALQTLCTQLSVFTRRCGLSDSACSELFILLEELFTNSLKYGRLPENSSVQVAISWEAGKIHLEYSDRGVEFDPVGHRATATGPHPSRLLRKGGIGLDMIYHYCEQIEYHRLDGRNVINLVYDTSRAPA